MALSGKVDRGRSGQPPLFFPDLQSREFFRRSHPPAHSYCNDLHVALRAAVAIATLVLGMKSLEQAACIRQVEFISLSAIANVTARFEHSFPLPIFFH